MNYECATRVKSSHGEHKTADENAVVLSMQTDPFLMGGGWRSLGKREFGCYQCGYCGVAVYETEPQ